MIEMSFSASRARALNKRTVTTAINGPPEALKTSLLFINVAAKLRNGAAESVCMLC